MSNDKKQKEEDKHKKLKQYAKENAEIAGIAGAGVLAGKKLVLDPASNYINRNSPTAKFNRNPSEIKKIHDAYKAEKLDDGIHILTDPENGKKVLSIHTNQRGDEYKMHELANTKIDLDYKNLTPEQLANTKFRIAESSVYRDELPEIRQQRDQLIAKLKKEDVSKRLKELYNDKNFSGSIHHTGEAGTMLHEMTHASRSGISSKFISNYHLPSTPGTIGNIVAMAPGAAFLATAKKRNDESEKDYQKRMGKNIGLATLGATALSAPGQVIEEGRANLGAIRRAKALGIKINTNPLKASYASYWKSTAGRPIAYGAGTYAAMKLWRRNKLKEEQNKAKLEKKSSLSDEQIIAGTETAKREANDLVRSGTLVSGALFPSLFFIAKRHGVSTATMKDHMQNNTPIGKKIKRDLAIASLGVGSLPYVLRKKSMKEYYNEQLEHAKKSKK
jgi:hypothetical protein